MNIGEETHKSEEERGEDENMDIVEENKSVGELKDVEIAHEEVKEDEPERPSEKIIKLRVK